MIYVKIPFKCPDKNKEFGAKLKDSEYLIIKVKGSKHPYNDDFNIINETFKLAKWTILDEFWVPDWAHEITITFGLSTKKFACEGRDIFITYKDYMQRMRYRFGNEAREKGIKK